MQEFLSSFWTRWTDWTDCHKKQRVVLENKTVVYQSEIGPFTVTSGVGMTLKDGDHGLEITEILPNGPVYHTDNLREGDVLKTVYRKLVGNAGKSAKDLFRVLINIRLLGI